MDRPVHVYKGTPGDHCVCDQALRPISASEWVIVFMTGGDHEPRRENYIAIVRTGDAGASWSAPKLVLRYGDRGCLLSEIVARDGKLTVFGQSHQGRFEDWHCFTITSEDGGYSWSAPETFAPVPRRAFIRNLYVATWGTWYLPLQTYDIADDAVLSPLEDGTFQRGMNGVLISTDEGAQWSLSDLIGPQPGWNENNLVELADGRLVMLCRADGTGELKRSESVDRGRTWSPWAASGIPNPGSKFRLHRLRDGRILLLHNPNPAPRGRNPLALWISDDDMATWGYQRVITDFPGLLSYPDGFVTDDEQFVHFAFDYNRHDLIAVSSEIPQRST